MLLDRSAGPLKSHPGLCDCILDSCLVASTSECGLVFLHSISCSWVIYHDIIPSTLTHLSDQKVNSDSYGKAKFTPRFWWRTLKWSSFICAHSQLGLLVLCFKLDSSQMQK